MLSKLFWLWIGGGLGTLGRYGLTSGLHLLLGLEFPYGTLGVNLIGCFLMGIIGELFSHLPLPTELRLFLMTGLLGGFTTFSAFGLETLNLLKEGLFPLGMLYILSSVVLGISAVWLGEFFLRTLLPST